MHGDIGLGLCYPRTIQAGLEPKGLGKKQALINLYLVEVMYLDAQLRPRAAQYCCPATSFDIQSLRPLSYRHGFQ